jgi:hypothetical protein
LKGSAYTSMMERHVAAKWAQLVEKRVSPLGLELDLVVLEHRDGPGLWAAQLLELLLAGDRVHVTVHLAANRLPLEQLG